MRKGSFYLIIIGLGVFFASCHSGELKWSQYSSTDGGFTIYMPANPKITEKTENTPFGKQTVHYVTWKPKSVELDKLLMFQVSYTNCPARVLQDSVLMDVMLDSSIRMSAENYSEKELETQAISLNGYPGRAFIYNSTEGNEVMIVKECIINNRKYNLSVVIKSNYATATEVDNFFNSFKILW